MLAQPPSYRRPRSATAAALLASAVAHSDSTGPDAISVEFNISPPIIGVLLAQSFQPPHPSRTDLKK